MFEAVSAWLIGERSRRGDLTLLMSELPRRLNAAGLPITRMRMLVLAMHPEVFGRVVQWTRDHGVAMADNHREVFRTPAYVGSPIEAMQEGLDRVRARLEQGEVPYRQLEELRSEGATDYAAFAIELAAKRRTFISFSTNRPGGFDDAALAAFEEVLPALAIRLELESLRFSSQTLLQLYLGQNASARVLAGDFRRGTGQVIHAAIWLCDLRGFTALADKLPLPEVVPILDEFFEAMSSPVREAGGEILKFIGDSILAVYPTANDTPGACRRAVAAASRSLDAYADAPAAREHGLRAGVAVNLGDVMYGNVGASDRLDFTVIGAAVNEAARMESLCKELRVPLVLAAPVAEHLDEAERHPLGSHALRGIGGPRALFTLRRYAPAA